MTLTLTTSVLYILLGLWHLRWLSKIFKYHGKELNKLIRGK